MAELEEEGSKPGALSWVGCGCGCLGGLVAVGGIMGILATVLGAINYGSANVVYGSAGGALCVGSVVALVGVVLYFKGHK